MIVVMGAGAIAAISPNPLEAMTTITTRIVSQLTGGIAGLFKHNGVTTITGRGKVLAGAKVDAADAAAVLQRVIDETRESRDMHSLFGVLDRLDEASLVAQRRLTVPFIRDVIDGKKI